MISIPVEEYHRLLAAADHLDDVRAYDAARARIASGEDEMCHPAWLIAC